MSDPLPFPAPRPLTPEELANPIVQAMLACRDPAVAAAAWTVLDPPEPEVPSNVTQLDAHRTRRP